MTGLPKLRSFLGLEKTRDAKMKGLVNMFWQLDAEAESDCSCNIEFTYI